MNAFCTIITADHIHYALALRKSLLGFGKNFSFHILVSGKERGWKKKIENKYDNTFLYFTEKICNDGVAKAIYTKYYPADMDAFRWSMKPVFINYLLQEKNFDKVIYTDCDIHFYNDYHFLLDELDQYNVLISPHWRSSDPHADLPNFELLYTNGIYNGGLVGANKHGSAAMVWWAMSCEFICVKNTTIGMFVDQVHLNLLPVYFEKVGIIKHRGCNVANWNMVECERSVAADQKTVIIAQRFPVVFIHFTKSTIDGIYSGVDPLLLPYLERYYASINEYAMETELLKKLTISFPKRAIVSPVKMSSLGKIKKIIKRIIQ
jgi:hypothetical protein